MRAIEQIKAERSILDIANTIGLKIDTRLGKATASCPFCKDTGKHLYLYLDSNRFYCFKCHTSGDQIDLYCKLTNTSPKTAVIELGRPGAGQQSIKQRSPHQEARTEPIEKKDIPQDFSSLYFDVIASMEITAQGREYLNSRGINDDLIRIYDIKSIDDPNQFKLALLKSYDQQQLIDAGLLDYSKNGKLYSTFFQPAVLFPHFDRHCTKISSISSRNLAGDSKSFKLHGNSCSYQYGSDAQYAKEIFVFEGIINGMSYEALTGSANWIACCGLISPAKYEELRRESPNQKLILGLDPDQAGKDTLAKIESCTYIDWAALARKLGFRELQQHKNGKAWDMNDYLINTRGKNGKTY